ncbi:hypothetical protein GCM10020254_58900 [Streptomyces goshikiensis]
MFLSRGNPVIYSGDEQGFTGAGGDKDARQPLFASRVADYLDDAQLGTARTHASDAYDPRHPLYRQISALSQLTKEHPALRDGVQSERFSDGAVYAFARTDSRTDTRGRTEYLVAANNASESRTVEIDAPAGAQYRTLYGGTALIRASAAGKLTVVVPALGSVVLQGIAPLAAPATGPALTLKAPAAATGTVELSADVTAGGLNRVVFAAQAGNEPWQVLGSADHAPYKVTQHVTAPAGTALRYKAVVIDAAGRTASALAASVAGQTPPVPVPTATQRDYAIVHYNRPDGDYANWRLYAWGDIADGESTPWPEGHGFTGRDAYGAFAHVRLKPGASSVGYLVIDKDGTKDVAADRAIDVTRTGEIWLEQGKEAARTDRPATPPADRTKAVLHYQRPDGAYDGWGLHVWTGAANPTDWSKPLPPTRTDSYGAVYEVPLAAGATSLSYILHKGDEKDLPSDQSLDLAATGHEVWMLGGQAAYLLPQPAGSSAALDLTKAQAVWIDRDTLAWNAPRGRRLRPAPGLPRGHGQGRERHPDRRRERPVAAPGQVGAHRGAAAKVPAPGLVHRLHRRSPRPGARPRGPARPARRERPRRERRRARRDRRPARRRARRPVRDERPARPGLRGRPPDPLRLGPPRPGRSPSNSTAAPWRCAATTPPASGRCAASAAGAESPTATPSPSGPRAPGRPCATWSPTRTPRP